MSERISRGHDNSAWKQPQGTRLRSLSAGANPEGKRTRVPKDIDEQVGSNIWRATAEHKEDPWFWTKRVHQLSTQFLPVIIFPNCHPGRCGGWEQIDRADMLEQLSKRRFRGCPVVCETQDSEDTYGFLKKWEPECLLKALRTHSEFPLGACYFWTPRTQTQMVIVPMSFGARLTLLDTVVPSPLGRVWILFLGLRFFDDRAPIDVDSSRMARTTQNDPSDQIHGVCYQEVPPRILVFRRLC